MMGILKADWLREVELYDVKIFTGESGPVFREARVN